MTKFPLPCPSLRQVSCPSSFAQSREDEQAELGTLMEDPQVWIREDVMGMFHVAKYGNLNVKEHPNKLQTVYVKNVKNI